MRTDALVSSAGGAGGVSIRGDRPIGGGPARAQEKSAAGAGAGAVAEAPVANAIGPSSAAPAPVARPLPSPGLSQLPDLTKRENFSSAMQLVVLLTVLSLAPAILLMMTSFTRIVIVLSLLRQALGRSSSRRTRC